MLTQVSFPFQNSVSSVQSNGNAKTIVFIIMVGMFLFRLYLSHKAWQEEEQRKAKKIAVK
jgi:hypothetical protein